MGSWLSGNSSRQIRGRSLAKASHHLGGHSARIREVAWQAPKASPTPKCTRCWERSLTHSKFGAPPSCQRNNKGKLEHDVWPSRVNDEPQAKLHPRWPRRQRPGWVRAGLPEHDLDLVSSASASMLSQCQGHDVGSGLHILLPQTVSARLYAFTTEVSTACAPVGNVASHWIPQRMWVTYSNKRDNGARLQFCKFCRSSKLESLINLSAEDDVCLGIQSETSPMEYETETDVSDEEPVFELAP